MNLEAEMQKFEAAANLRWSHVRMEFSKEYKAGGTRPLRYKSVFTQQAFDGWKLAREVEEGAK